MIRRKSFLLIIFSLVLVILGTENVKAKELNYYTNENGVSLTEKEFYYVNDFYGEDYFDKMTLEDYSWLEELDIENSEIEISNYTEYLLSTMSTSHATASKKITISKACGTSSCTVSTYVVWYVNPTIRSYDVIGARLVDTSLLSTTITTKVTSSAGTTYSTNSKIYSNGFGVSIKLPTSATSLTLEQRFVVATGGTIFATYQHAIKSITLATSQLYTISSSGYGNVLLFSGAALNSFDQMSGVNISV